MPHILDHAASETRPPGRCGRSRRTAPAGSRRPTTTAITSWSIASAGVSSPEMMRRMPGPAAKTSSGSPAGRASPPTGGSGGRRELRDAQVVAVDLHAQGDVADVHLVVGRRQRGRGIRPESRPQRHRERVRGHDVVGARLAHLRESPPTEREHDRLELAPVGGELVDEPAVHERAHGARHRPPAAPSAAWRGCSWGSWAVPA